MHPRHVALALLVVLIWGTNFVAINEGLQSVPPFLFLAIRFVAVTIPAVFLVKRPAVRWRDLAAIGLTISLGQFSLLYLAMYLGMPPGLSSLVLQAQVLFTVLIAAWWLRERPTRRQQVGVVLGGAGLVTIALGRDLSAPLLPLFVLLLAALSWSLGNVITRRVGSRGDLGSGLGLTVWSGLFVPIPAFVLSLTLEGPEAITSALTTFPWAAVASTAFTAYLSSLVGYGIWNTLLARYPVAVVTPFAMLVPVFGMAAAFVAYREQPAPLELTGGVVLLLGVGITVLRRPGRPGVPVAGSTATGPSVVDAGEVDPPAGTPDEPAGLVERPCPTGT